MKHAYLIMAHNQENLLLKLINLLDDENNDIFIHLDKKMNLTIDLTTKKSNLYFIPRNNVHWGAYIQIKTELDLLKYAISKGNYDYYHLLSGQDLPIKSNKDINEFFEKNNGKEFVDFLSDTISSQNLKRVKYYHIPTERPSSIFQIKKFILYLLEKLIVVIQQLLKVDRIKQYSNITFQKGANWFSITSKLAKYTIEKEEEIEKIYKHTVCCDEIFLQTIIENSKFKEMVYPKGNLRFTIWTNQYHPNILTEENFEQLMNSECLFARKFNEEKSEKLIEKIEKYTGLMRF